MKILKSNTFEVFDTDNINQIERYIGPKPELSQILHQNHELSDYDFLQQYFPLDHRIFFDFTKSFYYLVS